jgi:hypothetical protein
MIGTCALCGTNANLIDSHFLPAALYQEMNDPTGPIKNMIVVTRDGTFQSPEQFSMPLLCQQCEIRFQQGGENWTLANRFRSDGSFLLRDMLLTAQPVNALQKDTKIYDADTVSGLNVQQLVYFAASLFWRAGIADWKVRFAEAPKIDLSPSIMEELRLFLLGQGSLPTGISFFGLVDAEPTPKRIMKSPTKVDVMPHARYEAHIPGMILELAIQVVPPFDDLSLNNAPRRIMLTPLVTQRVIAMGTPLILSSEPKGSLKKHFS